MRCGTIVYLSLLLVSFFAASLWAGDELTPSDVAKIRYVSSATLSPDGKWTAYSLIVPRDPLVDNGNASTELHVVDSSGNSRPFVTGKVSVSQISWSADSQTIMYLAKRGDDKNASLYGIPINGGESIKILEHETSISKYAWHVDGRQLAFLAKKKPDESKKKLADRGFNAEAYEEDLQNTLVWLVTPSSDLKGVALSLEGSASEIEWNPKGDRLAVAVAPTPLIDHFYMYRRIRIVDTSGEIHTKIENPGKLGAIRWSPNGKQLAFISGEDINDPAGARLMLADPETGKFNRVMADYTPDIVNIHWLNDTTLSVLGANGCQSELHDYDLPSRALTRRIPPHGTVFTSISFSAANSYTLVGESASHPPAVFSGAVGHKKLTDNNPWLSEKRFAKQEIVSYQARDGVTIQGVLIHPRDRVKGQRYPLILTVHGGPESLIPNGWVTRYSYPGQIAAARGFAVFYPNYRGSTGRGAAFAKSHQSDYGGKEFDDLLDAIDHLVKIGLVHRDKVGVTGGSYGGFASAWCATRHSEHFAASVMFVGISNQISKSGTTDIPDEMFHVHARKRIWDDWQFFLKRSPIYYVENAKTPILILHGKEDTRVHTSQSMELYRNLKILGQVPVRLVLYPGEGHGNRKAAARLDYNLRMMRWLEHYLKGEGGPPPAFELNPDQAVK
ncbi:MAG TPA: S9 family peptidase [Planctomycetes bacterium]|nr:S9 family peptidase [Planctomycetota bacterium]